MTRVVPFLKKDYIESEAESLIASYGARHGRVTQPPIPVDEIRTNPACIQGIVS